MWLLRVLRVGAILTPIVPARLAYLICRVAALLYYAINLPVRRNVLDNLAHVDPRMSFVNRQLAASRACITVVTNYYDLIRMRSVDRGSIFELVDLEGLETIECAIRRGRGIIILSAHVGNFSVMARLPAVLGYRAAVVAERVEPPQLFSYMVRLRSAMGIQVIPPGIGSARRAMKLLRNNGILLIAGDRDVTNHGMSVPFFGQETLLPPGPVLLAMRTGAALVPARTYRTSTRRSRVEIGSELQLECSGDWDHDLQINLRRMTAELERMIAADPGQWAVLQRVWPPRNQFGRSEGIGGIDEVPPNVDTARDRRFERQTG